MQVEEAPVEQQRRLARRRRRQTRDDEGGAAAILGESAPVGHERDHAPVGERRHAAELIAARAGTQADVVRLAAVAIGFQPLVDTKAGVRPIMTSRRVAARTAAPAPSRST